MIPVTALSSWTYCPVSFYRTYVLQEEEPPKDVMILGLIKHKLHETISKEEENLVKTLKPENIQQQLQQAFTKLLQTIIIKHSNALRKVNMPLAKAYQEAAPIVKFETQEKINRIMPFLQKGLKGENLWHALTPKIKTEYKIQSEKLGLKGRIDKLECHETGIIPVELKSGKPPKEGTWKEHRVQATAYALMLEDQFNTKIPTAAVCYIDHNTRRTITINPFMKEEITEITEKIRKTMETKELPEGCGRCEACRQIARQSTPIP
ncbi:CRISPR-associated protein Cas4 [Candidatus Woesearchaeota archaeon]|nr:CRISPR-associated protein Cas4 [Candidatus Woesearchaeota archaeon]MBW3016502.1 CRISPR-associated protein Cas4 [Candidatus Woesearchaeota archaeon]